MDDRQTAVALLFDEAELGAQLRVALEEHGARIVHEGSLAAFDAGTQARLDPDVLVVNLDDSDDDGIDRLYELVDGERPRLVFNDAQASRGLDGNDRARWARHLAVKVLASGDVDPPRPEGAPTIEVVAPPPVASAPEPPVEAPAGVVDTSWAHEEAVPAETPSADMDDLESELNALLSGAELAPVEEVAEAPAEPAPLPVGTDDLERLLAEAMPVEADQPEAPPAPTAPDWSLVDDASLAQALVAPPDAPVAEPVEPPALPASALSLVDVETVQATEPEHRVSEMLLDDLGSAPTRVIMLGATADGLDAVCDFLAALPADLHVALLLAQHFGAQAPDAVVRMLSAVTRLPVRLAESGSRARAGEIWLVPAGCQLQMLRDGSIGLQSGESASEPSIDDSFTMAAGVFGGDALGIVFASESTDAVAGAQAIHDRGGEVWVETSGATHHEGVAAALFAERLVSFAGTRQELAAHLIEVYP